ncbi:MAG: polysaccharide export protein, partial [Candidatus Omnitrophica bacterium]|nr:polysaccharide export protein [Candidatus Omnitrophota bacterium]
MKMRQWAFVMAGVCLCAAGAGAQETAETQYTVGIDDVLQIQVMQPEQIQTTVTVAADGTISFPYIGTVPVRDKTIEAITRTIERELADGYMKYPLVSVILLESRSRKFFVYGEVIKPGAYVLDANTTVLKAISLAGGFNKFGSTGVRILRPKENSPGYDTIKINIKAVMEGKSEADIPVRVGDIVV